MVTHQVTGDVPIYKVKDDGRNVKVNLHNILFLVVPTRETATPLGRGEPVSYVKKKDSPFTNVIAFLDELARHKLSTWAWNKLVYPPPLSQDSMPCRN